MLLLSENDVRVLASANSWFVCLRTPECTPQDIVNYQTLRILHNELCTQIRWCMVEQKPVVLKIGSEYFCDGGQMILTVEYFQILKDPLDKILKELGYSPKEIEAYSNVPFAEHVSLLKRLNAEVATVE